MAERIVSLNQGTIGTQVINIYEGQKTQLIYSDPLPDRSHFQGRKNELAQLTNWLDEHTVSLIGVRGEGGIGKSTLMAKVFAESLGFAGKFWADVRTGSSMAALAGRALQELGVLPAQVEKIEEKDLIPRLLRLLQQGRYLLAIDNLESVLTATGVWQSGYEEFLAGFQDLGSGSVLLLGSREYPPKYFGWQQSRWLTVEHGLEPTEGAALLAALEVEDTQEHRVAVSVQVQGNPLALALLAGWLRTEYRPGERTVERLQQTDLLQMEGRHRGEAQVSVERVLQWSIDRLTPALQNLLAQVSIFRGAFNYIAAATLILEQAVNETDLNDLERRSLLQVLPERDKYKLRVFRIQPRIREFAQKQTVDLTNAHERAIQYFWNSRQTEFGTEDNLMAIIEYEETFYHECQLSRYSDAFKTVFVCDRFLTLRGYYLTLVVLYSQLHMDWQPTLAQRQDYAAVCNNLGATYYLLGQYQEAIALHQEALAIQREIGDSPEERLRQRSGKAASLVGLGNAYQALGQYQEAIALHQEALAIQREIGDSPEERLRQRSGEATSLGNLGGAYRLLGQYQEAIVLQQQSLAITREIGDRSGEANSLGNLGGAYQSLGQYQEAIALQQQSLAIKREIGDRSGEAASLGSLGIAYDSLGQYQEAIALQQQSLAITREIGDRSGEANSLNNLGNAYGSLGQYQEAIALHQQSLAIEREIGDRSGEANSLINLGNAYRSLGQYQEAIALQQQSLAITREIGDRSGEANSLGNLGAAYDSLGQYQEAIALHQQSLAIKRETGDRSGEANSLINLGNAYQSLGQYQEAIALQQQSLAIKRETGDRSGEATSLGNLGNAYQSLGQYQEAIAFQQQSLAIEREIGNREGEAASLGNLGNAYQSLGQYQEAIALSQQSLDIQREIGDRSGEATSLGNLGATYQSLGQYQEAIDFQQQSLTIKREIGDRWGEGASLFNLGNALVQLDRQYEALQHYQQALAIYTALKLDHTVEQCKTAIEQCTRTSSVRRRSGWWQKWGLWFLVGLAIALLIWWLLR